LVAEALKMVTEWYHLSTGDSEACRRQVHELLKEDSFTFKVIQYEEAQKMAWFMLEELIKLLRSYIFSGERSLSNNMYSENYF
jgi:hypothetical protein